MTKRYELKLDELKKITGGVALGVASQAPKAPIVPVVVDKR